jgi:dTDP-4-amino-4,6-dideoxygalactose transaminase
MTDLQAAIGREQLKRLPSLIERRRRLARHYSDRLRHSGLEVPAEPDWACSNWQSYCVKLPASLSQRAVMQELLDQGISTRRGVMNIHLEQAYAEPGSYRAASSLARSVWAQRQAIILPLFAQMTDEDLSRVVEALAQRQTFAEPAAAQAG